MISPHYIWKQVKKFEPASFIIIIIINFIKIVLF
jgi:hypothetical protein